MSCRKVLCVPRSSSCLALKEYILIGSWWSLDVTGWSWFPRRQCTFFHSYYNEWGWRCLPGASSSHFWSGWEGSPPALQCGCPPLAPCPASTRLDPGCLWYGRQPAGPSRGKRSLRSHYTVECSSWVCTALLDPFCRDVDQWWAKPGPLPY